MEAEEEWERGEDEVKGVIQGYNSTDCNAAFWMMGKNTARDTGRWSQLSLRELKKKKKKNVEERKEKKLVERSQIQRMKDLHLSRLSEERQSWNDTTMLLNVQCEEQRLCEHRAEV